MRSSNIKILLAVLFSALRQVISGPQDNFSIEYEVCYDCVFPFEYDGMEFALFTFYSRETEGYEHNQPISWSVTNQTEFLENEAIGGEFRTSECEEESRTSHFLTWPLVD